jgi:hypothetical protein
MYPSDTSKMSSGELVTMMADNSEKMIKLNAIHGEFMRDHAALKNEINSYLPLRAHGKIFASIMCLQNRQNVWDVIELEMEFLQSDSGQTHLVIRRIAILRVEGSIKSTAESSNNVEKNRVTVNSSIY